jgi:hypothetical protein
MEMVTATVVEEMGMEDKEVEVREGGMVTATVVEEMGMGDKEVEVKVEEMVMVMEEITIPFREEIHLINKV